MNRISFFAASFALNGSFPARTSERARELGAPKIKD
jgi:hypothetical protein